MITKRIKIETIIGVECRWWEQNFGIERGGWWWETPTYVSCWKKWYPARKAENEKITWKWAHCTGGAWTAKKTRFSIAMFDNAVYNTTHTIDANDFQFRRNPKLRAYFQNSNHAEKWTSNKVPKWFPTLVNNANSAFFAVFKGKVHLFVQWIQTEALKCVRYAPFNVLLQTVGRYLLSFTAVEDRQNTYCKRIAHSDWITTCSKVDSDLALCICHLKIAAKQTTTDDVAIPHKNCCVPN